jgi:tetratricopeptide (TPR) repeat protein
MRLKNLSSAILFIFLICLSPAWPQSDNTLSFLNKTDEKVLSAESRGDSDEAIDYLSQALLELLKEQELVKGNERKLYTAISEAYLHKLVGLYSENYRFKDALKLLSKAEKHRTLPEFSAWVKYYLGILYCKTNDAAQGREKFSELGFINSWQVIGPFDNENGAGFNTPYQPENSIDLKASYDGRKKSVSWRHISVNDTSGGYINLSNYLIPNDNYIAYALTYVFSEEAKPVNFRMASEESIKLWLNGALLYYNDIQRARATLDQDIAAGTLEKGWNEILVKVSSTGYGRGFRLRITSADGSPLTGLKYASGQKEIAGISFPENPTRKKPRLTESALEYLEKMSQRYPEKTGYSFYVGLIHEARSDSDRHKPAEREAFLHTARVSLNQAYYYYYLAKSLQDETLSVSEKDENACRELMEMAVGLSPEHLRALTGLAEYYFYSMKNLTKTRDYLDRALKVNPDFPPARHLEIKWFEAKRFENEKLSALKSLAQKNPDYLPVQYDYANWLVNTKRPDEALLIYQHILRNVDYTDAIARNGMIDILVKKGRLAQALQLHDVSVWLGLSPVESYIARAKIMESLEDYEKALLETRKALELCPDNYIALGMEGMYLRQLGNTDEAKVSWAKALLVNPNYLWLQRYMEWVESSSESFETPYKIDPETIIEELKESKTAPAIQDSSAYFLLNQSVNKINKDGTCRKYIHLIIRILSEKGIKDFQKVSLSYNPEQQRIKMLTARVIYPDGRRADATYQGGYAMDLPPLEANAVIDLEYRRDDTQVGFFGDYFGDTFYFNTTNPAYKASYILIAPPDKPIYFNMKNAPLPENQSKIIKEENKTVYLWELNNIPGFTPEPLMPPLEETAPMLQVSSYPAGEKGWKEFGKWYWNLIKRQYDITDEMRDALKPYIKPAAPVEAKIWVAYTYVISEIRYVAWEYGIHGWKPYRASTIFARRFGDCKDKATMINVFLNDMGITAYPVLIYAEESKGKDDLTLPMVEHFNHCISYVSLENGQELWLDGTAVFNAMGTVPAADTDSKVVVLNETGGVIKEIPPLSPADNSRREMNTVRIDKKGNARLNIKLLLKGERAGEIRYYFFNPAKRNLLMERMLGALYGGTEVTSVKTSRLEELETPASVTVEANIPKFAQAKEDTPERPADSLSAGKDLSFKAVLFPPSRLGRDSAIAPQGLSGLAALSERKFDLLLPINRFPYEDSIRNEFILPLDAQVKSIPENVELATKFGTFKITYEITPAANAGDNERIVFTEKVTLKTRRISAKDYKEFREFVNRIAREEEREITITFKQ